MHFEQLRYRPAGGTRALLEHHQVPFNGVIHVGAHHGEELEHYLACGFERVLYLEPDPDAFVVLQGHLQYWRDWLGALHERYRLDVVPHLEALACAAGPDDGQGTLYQTEDAGRSSLLSPMGMALRGQLQVPTRRLDTLLADRLTDFSLLTMDVQGAELQVLEGAPRLLQSIGMVVLEVNLVRRYEGCPLAHEVDAYMEERGFRAVARAIPAGAIGGNFAYLRER